MSGPCPSSVYGAIERHLASPMVRVCGDGGPFALVATDYSRVVETALFGGPQRGSLLRRLSASL
jgi:hypothetical protein